MTLRPTGVDDVLDILSSRDDRDLTEIVQLAASICGGSAAGITIRRGEYYHVPITHGIDPFVCAAEETFCRLTMETDEVFTVEDARRDPRFADIGFVNGFLARARFYASAPIHDPAGSMVGRLCIIADEPRQLSEVQVRGLETLGVSVSKIIELRLLHAAAPVPAQPTGHDLDTVLSQFSSELSHDLKVPLTGVVASLELLSDHLGDAVDPVAAALLERCSASAQRMTRMLQQQLSATAADVGPAPTARVDLGSVAQRLVADSATLLESSGAVVEVGDLPVVRADADKAYSVLQNLVANSVKFARPGVPARVLITARRLHDCWRIAVVDNGVGIPADRRVDVFSLFSRVDPGVEGHGIGLATVARIVAGHGGRVGATQSPDGGTEIWFTLPAA